MTNASIPAHPSERAASSDQWLELVDQVLLGLDHALNNRLGALRAFAELLRDDVWRTTSAATDSVQKEVARLEETTSVVRLLARPRQPSETGLILEDVIADVVRIQSMLYDVRDTPIELAPGPPIEPVWSERSALIRLLSVALYSLRRQTRAAGGEAVRVATESDESSVRIKLTSSVPASALAIGEYAAATASSLGADWRTQDGSWELHLPTLKSHRGSSR
jgi:C4-dicarboxylate-specific signal transduction histidine kinase